LRAREKKLGCSVNEFQLENSLNPSLLISSQNITKGNRIYPFGGLNYDLSRLIPLHEHSNRVYWSLLNLCTFESMTSSIICCYFNASSFDSWTLIFV